MWHGYIGIENLNLNNTQRQALMDELKALGPASNPQPACLCHWRIRLDNDAAIFEVLFDEDDLTISKFKDRLGVIFDIEPATIEHSIGNQTFDTLSTPIATFSRDGTDYLRLALFGGQSSSWMQSGNECRAYLLANLSEWEET